jgi:hypothetical protein
MAEPIDYRVQQVVHSSLLRQVPLRGTPRLSAREVPIGYRESLREHKEVTAEN